MKKVILIPLLFLCSFASAQESHALLFRVGLGTYSMKTQKQFQKDFIRNSKIRMMPVHSFPAFPTFGTSLGFKVSPSVSLGAWGEYASTGGRLHYGDYSGYSQMDQVLKSFQAGPFIQYRIVKSSSWPLYLSLHSSLAHTTEKLTSEIEVGGQFNSESYKLRSLNFTLRPGVILAHQINVFVLQMGIGSEFQLAGDLKDVKDKDLLFRTSDGTNLTAQWDGLRLTFGFGFKL